MPSIFSRLPIPSLRCRVLMLCVVVAACAHAQTITAGTELESIAAVVGGEAILTSELNYAVQVEKQQYPGVADSVLRAQVLQSLIDQKVFYVKAVEDSVTVTDDEVTQQLDYQMQQIVQSYGSEKRVESVYGKSIAQIKREYRDEVKKRIMGERWRGQKLGEQPRVTRKEVEAFFAQYKDSLAVQKVPVQYDCAVIAMTVRASSQARDSARAIGNHLLDSLQHGASFAELARQWSEDPSSAKVGGDLGFQKRGIFVKEFDQIAFGLKEGQTSGLVETMFGYHIIQVIERRGEEVHARHILIKVPKTRDDEQAALDSLAKVRARIAAGESFNAVAMECSQETETRSFGGDLGPLPLAAFPSAVGEVIKTLKPGEISAPVKTTLSGGEAAFKIFLLKRVIPEHIPTLDTDYRQIERIAGLYMQQKNLDALIQDVRSQVYWKIVK